MGCIPAKCPEWQCKCLWGSMFTSQWANQTVRFTICALMHVHLSMHVWHMFEELCDGRFCFSKAYVNKGRRRRTESRVEDGGRYGDRAVGLSRRRERLVSKEMCVRDESVWDRLCLGAHLEGRVPLHHSLLCLSLPHLTSVPRSSFILSTAKPFPWGPPALEDVLH